MALKQGDSAPDFTLLDQNGEMHTLSGYRGRWVLVYFYPRDDTPGCTKEACGFRNDHARLTGTGAVVLGVGAKLGASGLDMACDDGHGWR